jgi:hypothetical protein
MTMNSADEPRCGWYRGPRGLAIAGVALTVALMILAGCGDDDPTAEEPGSTFDGETCSYDGPTNFELGTVTFHVLNDSDANAGFSVVKVFDDTTAADITADGIRSYVETLPEDGEIRQDGTNDEGVEYDLTVDFDAQGTWAANCWVARSAPWGAGLDVAILTVNS